MRRHGARVAHSRHIRALTHHPTRGNLPPMPLPAPHWRKTGPYVPKIANVPGAPDPWRKTGLHVPESAMDPRWELDQAIAAIADEHHGVVSLHQLVMLGLSDSAVRKRVKAGRLIRLYRGVFAVGHQRLTIHGRWMAAVLAAGPGAALSHRHAA